MFNKSLSGAVNLHLPDTDLQGDIKQHQEHWNHTVGAKSVSSCFLIVVLYTMCKSCLQRMMSVYFSISLCVV